MWRVDAWVATGDSFVQFRSLAVPSRQVSALKSALMSETAAVRDRLISDAKSCKSALQSGCWPLSGKSRGGEGAQFHSGLSLEAIGVEALEELRPTCRSRAFFWKKCLCWDPEGGGVFVPF